ncbi:MAG: hypothetical protein MUE73_21215 [Planctomycetes bacterium]|jgi:hypothetical protein|nr:hypothetical protein [Planctomycetota bacterium]
MAGLRNRIRIASTFIGATLAALTLVFLPAFHTCDPFHGCGPGTDAHASAHVGATHDHDGHVDGPDTCPACQIHSGTARAPLTVRMATRLDVLSDRPPIADARPLASDVLVPPARAPPA